MKTPTQMTTFTWSFLEEIPIIPQRVVNEINFGKQLSSNEKLKERKLSYKYYA